MCERVVYIYKQTDKDMLLLQTLHFFLGVLRKTRNACPSPFLVVNSLTFKDLILPNRRLKPVMCLTVLGSLEFFSKHFNFTLVIKV